MRETILITGCGAGLGLELASQLYSMNKYNLIITARQNSLIELSKIFQESDFCIIREVDLLKESTFSPVISEAVAKWGSIDILINNAAVSYRAMLEHVSDDEEKMQMQTNYFGPRELIRQIVYYMKLKRKGKIINISSVSGMMAMPTMSSYSASKHALEGMSEALWYELKPFGIKVSIVQIGFVKSLSFQRVIVASKAQDLAEDDIYRIYYESMSEFIAKMMKLTPSSPKKISRVIIEKVINNKNPNLRVPATIDAIFFSLTKKLIPQRIYHNFLYFFLPSSLRMIYKKFKKYILENLK